MAFGGGGGEVSARTAAAGPGMQQDEVPAPRARRPWSFVDSDGFPWWLVALVGVVVWMAVLSVTNDRYREARSAIDDGFVTTLRITAVSFVAALVLGLLIGLARISRNPVLRNVARFYIEFVRGIPALVLIFMVSLVFVAQVNEWLDRPNTTSQATKFTIALAIFYGAFLAEVFRAGIESIPKGQFEAGRSLGLSHGQTLFRIIVPQGVRNVLPALGNDLISCLKDTALASAVAAPELTQKARVYSGSNFQYRPAYFVLTLFYLSMTLVLSLFVNWYQQRLRLAQER